MKEREIGQNIHKVLICITQESNRSTRFTRPTRPTDPMNVRFDRIRHLEVDDQGNVWYIDTSSC